MSCSGENCNSQYIQNKKYNLCSECIYKKNHEGKSRQEVQMEKQQQKYNKGFVAHIIESHRTLPPIKKLTQSNLEDALNICSGHFSVDEEAQKNIQNQDIAEQKAIEEEGVERFLKSSESETEQLSKLFEPRWIGGDPKPGVKLKPTDYLHAFSKKKKSVKQISRKQAEINHLYKLTCIDMDHITEPVCTGCLRYQGGDIKLSHSHIISREDCKRIGREELIYDRDNLTYHCMTFGENTGCHGKWENPKQRTFLADYEKNIKYIKSISQELYLKYKQ